MLLVTVVILTNWVPSIDITTNNHQPVKKANIANLANFVTQNWTKTYSAFIWINSDISIDMKWPQWSMTEQNIKMSLFKPTITVKQADGRAEKLLKGTSFRSAQKNKDKVLPGVKWGHKNMVSYLTPHCAISRITQGVWKIRRIHLLPSSAKPQLPAVAKLAELQPYFAFHPAPPPTRVSRF